MDGEPIHLHRAQEEPVLCPWAGCRRIGHPLIVIVRIYVVVGSVKSTLGHAFRFAGLAYAGTTTNSCCPLRPLVHRRGWLTDAPSGASTTLSG